MQGGLTKKFNIYSIKTNTHRCSSSKALDASTFWTSASVSAFGKTRLRDV